jgi:S-adenosylmethionine/arginine decarboxylase-like enzyme
MISKGTTEFEAIMDQIQELANAASVNNTATRFEAKENESLLIIAKEIHLCIMRHTYRMDNLRHTYDEHNFNKIF